MKYAKGALIALCLDALLRKTSDSSMSLDNLMRALWQRWLHNEAGIAEDEPQRLAAQLLNTDLTDFFDRVLYSTDDLPIKEALTTLGVSIEWSERLSSSDMGGNRSSSSTKAATVYPWLGANVVDAPGGMRIAQLMSGGPAAKAGLSAGDIIVAINHFLGRLRETVLPVEPAPRDTAVLQIEDKKAVEQWLADSRLAADDSTSLLKPVEQEQGSASNSSGGSSSAGAGASDSDS